MPIPRSEQLGALNVKASSDAFLTAKIIGFDRSEIEQLKADVRELRQENADLRAQLQRARRVRLIVLAGGARVAA